VAGFEEVAVHRWGIVDGGDELDLDVAAVGDRDIHRHVGGFTPVGEVRGLDALEVEPGADAAGGEVPHRGFDVTDDVADLGDASPHVRGGARRGRGAGVGVGEGQDDFAGGCVSPKSVGRDLGLCGRVDAIEMWGDSTVPNCRENLGDQRLDNVAELCPGTDAEGSADEFLSAEGDGVQVHLDRRAGEAPDTDDPSGDGSRGGQLAEQVAADMVEGDVRSVTVRRLEDGFGEVAGCGVDGDVCAGGHQGSMFVLGRGGGDHRARAERLGELDADEPDRAGAADDENAVAGGEAGLGNKRVVLGDEPDRQGRGLLEAEMIGDRDEHPRVTQRVVGEGARGDAHDSGPHRKIGSEQARPFDYPGNLHARGERAVALTGSGVGAVECVQVRTIDTGGHHLDPDRPQLLRTFDLLNSPFGAVAADQRAHGHGCVSPGSVRCRDRGRRCRSDAGPARRPPWRARRSRRGRA
jgi:hypothetical protein